MDHLSREQMTEGSIFAAQTNNIKILLRYCVPQE
jgi:hypothetical protein